MTATIQAQDGALTSPPPAKAKKPADPRYLALRNFALSISAFNAFGYTMLGFEQPWLYALLAVITGYLTDLFLETIMAWAYQRRPEYRGRGMRGLYEFLLPAHITSLAMNMLIYANNQFWPIMFGVMVAVGSKYVLRAPINGRMRHFMNPSNLGISVCLLLFAKWISISPPYMFSEWASSYFRLFIPIVILVSGTVLNTMLTKRVALIVGWMGGFFIQAFVRHWLWGVQLNTALTVMTGIAFVLFTNYMITDPGTTPSRPRNQFMFGSMVAFVYAVLMQFNIVYTLFFAVCIVCGFRGLGHWGLFWMKKRQTAGAGPEGATVTGSGAGTVPATVASNGAGGKVAAGETVTT
ncbi:MAG TPA: enediyne biosynthesis protein [Streptosporangiaceae bacterium]|nr:enediyne biosynthesis protein [Streptosporangiaceae bacterium]